MLRRWALMGLLLVGPVWAEAVDLRVGPMVMLAPAAEACGKDEWPDTPARAMVDADGKLVVYATGKVGRVMRGESLTSLKRDCKTVALQGAKDADPTVHNDRVWIHSVWSEDGKTVRALVHNEYQGSNHLELYPECKGRYVPCWWNSVVWGESVDGGRTFALAGLKERVVAAMRYDYVPNVGKPVGFMNPSNLLTVDDYLMGFVYVMGYKDQKEGNYLIRKPREAPWTAWEVYDRKRFVALGGEKTRTVGKPLGLGRTKGWVDFKDDTPMRVVSVSKHISGTFVALLTAKQPNKGEAWRDGYYVATSPDMLAWSEPKPLVNLPLRKPDCKTHKGPVTIYRYGALLDEAASRAAGSRMLEVVGDEPMLVVTRLVYPTCAESQAALDLVGWRVGLGGILSE